MVKTTLAYRFFGRFGKFWSQVLYTISLTTNLQILKSNPIYTTYLHSIAFDDRHLCWFLYKNKCNVGSDSTNSLF